MPSPSNFFIEQLIKDLSTKVDAINEQFKYYVLYEDFHRQIGEIKSELKAINSRYNEDMKWSNEERDSLKEKMDKDNKQLRDEIMGRMDANVERLRKYFFTLVGTGLAAVLAAFFSHLVFK
jgi:hypothetical protein